MGFPLPLLLSRLARGFLRLGPVQIARIAAIALVLGIAGLLQGDRDRLPAALHRSAFAAWSAF